MIKYDEIKMTELFKKHRLTQFKVLQVFSIDGEIFMRVKQKECKLFEYLRDNPLTYLKFKSSNLIYEVKFFYTNIDGTVRGVFVIKKDDKILEILSLYEVKNYEKFNYECGNLIIDEILKEM